MSQHLCILCPQLEIARYDFSYLIPLLLISGYAETVGSFFFFALLKENVAPLLSTFPCMAWKSELEHI